MNRLLYYLHKLKIEDVKCVFLLILLFFPGKLLGKIRKNIWIIAERPNIADDNGWIFFKWIKKNHPDDLAFFILDKNAEQFSQYGKSVIAWGSLRHYIYYIASDYHINVMFNSVRPNKRVCPGFEKVFKKGVKELFLQHGVVKDGYEMFTYEKRHFRLFICGAKPEYDYLNANCGYPEGYMQYTGLARFDELLDCTDKDNFILLMPTWRRYIGYDINKTEIGNEKDFIDSEYYRKYSSLINSKKLNDFLRNNNLKIKFCLHPMFKKYADKFFLDSTTVELVDEKISIHELLMKMRLLITDYSSVFFDAAYAGTPVIYYHFDYNEFRRKHFSEGYFSYEKDGVGPITYNEDELIGEIIKYHNNAYKREDIYNARCRILFPLHDKNNCQRIYESIQQISR